MSNEIFRDGKLVFSKKSRLPFALVFGVCFAFASCSNFFQGKVDMPTSETSSLVDFFKKDTVGGKLDPPSKIYVDSHEYQDKIRISWESVAGAAYYRLERAVITEKKADGSFQEPKDEDFDVMDYTISIYGTSHTDIIIDGTFSNELDYKNERYGYAYFYRVSAENPRAGYDASDFTTSSLAALFSPVTNVNASMGKSEEKIDVTWNPVDGARSYEIYRTRESDGSNLKRIGSTPRTLYSDTSADSYQGEDLYYVIKAISGNGSASVESPVALGYTKIPGAPDEVEGVVVKTGRGDVTANDGIEIKWEEVEGEGILYSVYRSSSSSSTLVPIKTGEESTSYKDTSNLQGDTYYYYYVQAYTKKDDVIMKGAMSDSGPSSEKPAQGFIISPPPAVVVSKKEGDGEHCIIKFTAPIGSKHYIPDGDKTPEGAKTYEYNVYAGPSESALSKVLSGCSPSGEPDADGYYSVEVKSEGFYAMTTVHDGKESAQSKIAAPAPYAARNVIVTKGEMVGDYADYKPGSVSDKKDSGWNTNGVHPVKITWQEPEGGATSYYVYRSTQRDSGWKRITDSPTKVREYVDKNDVAKPGIIYYYRVLSLNSMEQGANYSQVDAPVLKDNVIDRTQGYGWGYGALSVWQYMQEERKTVESSQGRFEKDLMHKTPDTAKVGSDTAKGIICGKLDYTAKIQGFGARIIMPYTNYADFYINNDKSLGIYFLFNGNTNTTADMSADGNMDGIVTCSGMYPGKVRYDKVQIKGGNAGGGTYGVIRDGIDSDYIEVDWKAGEK